MRVLEYLECAASASLLYLKGAAYMAVESPTGGPNDVVQNNILYRHYGIAGDGDLIPEFPCSGPWESFVRHSHALSCRNGARV